MAMTNHEVAEALREIGQLLELTGESSFKTRAYENAARHIEGLGEDIAALVAADRLRTISGIGESIAKKITELVETGKLQYLEDLRQQVPPGLPQLLRIPDLGPKRVGLVWKKLGVTTIAELEAACQAGKLRTVAGFGEKTEQNILAGIAMVQRSVGRQLLGDALPDAEALLDALRALPGVIHAELGGSLRRRKELIRDIDLLATSATPEQVMDAFVALPQVEKVLERGPTKSAVLLTNHMNCDLRVVPEESFAAALQYFTGSAEHNIALRGLAKDLGYKISEYGLFTGERNLKPKTEADLYERLGLAYIPPELREDTGEIDAAKEGRLPALVSDADCVGVIHAHTAATDGHATLAEMADAARALGYKYLVICEHSRSATYANGLDIAQLRAHIDAVRALSKKYKDFTLLIGSEVDILADGSLDYPDTVLAKLDLVIASVHSRFKMTSEEMTARIIKAVRNPYCHVVGHLTGRLLLARDGYPVDQERVIDAAADTGTMFEINAHPQRLDLDWLRVKSAHSKGVKLALCPDAHDPEGLADMRYGVMVARRGWCEKADIINTRSAEELVAFCRAMTERKLKS